MNEYVENTPFVALVDDDQHSASLLTRTLLAHGSPRVQRFGDAADGYAKLSGVLTNSAAVWPSLIIVDLKSHSAANLDFLRSIQPMAYQTGVSVVVMLHPAERGRRDLLEASGAAAIFFRHTDRDAYRREAASLVSFWAQSQRLDAVGM